MGQAFSNKRQGETVRLGFDFSPILNAGVTLLTATWRLIDPEDPDVVIAGVFPEGPAIDETWVLQRFMGGDPSTSYYHEITVTTSDGQTLIETPSQLITCI
jgi:hypothetical protein